MKSSHLPSTFSAATNTGESTRNGFDTSSPSWQKHLPAGWQNATETPLYFKQYSEYEMPAERVLGYDADEQPCFTSHRFLLTTLTSDDGEELYEIVTYREEMAAWRLRDERWLVFRLISTNSYPPRGFYALSPDMPR